MTAPTNNIHKRGFGSMDKDRLREISKRAGASVPAEKRMFSRDPELAKRAGALGGAKKYGLAEFEKQTKE